MFAVPLVWQDLSLNASKPAVEKLLPLSVGTAFSQMCQKSSTLTCVLSGSRLNQLSSADRSTMACSLWIWEQGTTLSLWQSCQCLSNKAVGWQPSGALSTSILQRVVISLLDHVGELRWSAAGSCFGHWAALLHNEGGKGVRAAAEWSIRCHLPKINRPWTKPEEETEKHSHLFFFILYPTLYSSVFHYTSWLLLDLQALPTLSS